MIEFLVTKLHDPRFMTSTPIDIQIAQPTSINWPVGCVHSSEM